MYNILKVLCMKSDAGFVYIMWLWASCSLSTQYFNDHNTIYLSHCLCHIKNHVKCFVLQAFPLCMDGKTLYRASYSGVSGSTALPLPPLCKIVNVPYMCACVHVRVRLSMQAFFCCADRSRERTLGVVLYCSLPCFFRQGFS